MTTPDKPSTAITTDPWHSLRSFTHARIALGRAGAALPVAEALQFRLAHAHARDAVYSILDTDTLRATLETQGHTVAWVQSQAHHREEYLKRPDLGRILNFTSRTAIQQLTTTPTAQIAIILADGLSATAINNHALPVLTILLKKFEDAALTLAPVILATQSRVALADEIGELLNVKLSIILIGERPGLSSPESMGAYLTFNPRSGLTDEARNCISNIHPQGLPYAAAADTIFYLARTAFSRELTGIALKDETPPQLN